MFAIRKNAENRLKHFPYHNRLPYIRMITRETPYQKRQTAVQIFLFAPQREGLWQFQELFKDSSLFRFNTF